MKQRYWGINPKFLKAIEALEQSALAVELLERIINEDDDADMPGTSTP